MPNSIKIPNDPFAGLRGILACWIVFAHMLLHERYAGIYDAGFARHEDIGILGPMMMLHGLGVDIFFMLSGLVLTLHYFDHFTRASTGREIDRFYLRRLRRLWPMHAAMVALIGLFEWVGIPHPISSHLEGQIFAHPGWTLALNLLFMNGWGIIPVASWNEPAWSLSMVFFLSVLFPNLLLILKRLPQKSWLYGLLILAVILGFALWRLFAPGVSYSDGMGAVIRGLVFFTAGMLLALYIRTDGHSLPRSGRWVPLAFLGMVVLWTYLFQFPLTLFHLLYAPLLLTLYRGIPALIPPDLSQWLGARSFALCMSHYPCLLAIRYFLGDFLHQAADTAIWGKAGCYFLVIALVLLMAEITYRLFDRPRISTVPPTIR